MTILLRNVKCELVYSLPVKSSHTKIEFDLTKCEIENRKLEKKVGGRNICMVFIELVSKLRHT